MLAALSEEELELRLNHRKKLRKFTDKSISSLVVLKQALEQVRCEGVARDYEECFVGVHCIAHRLRAAEVKCWRP